MKAAQESQGVNLEREFEARLCGAHRPEENEKKRTAATLTERQKEEGGVGMGCGL